MRFLILLFLCNALWGQSYDQELTKEAGRQLFAGTCSTCHGPNGVGGDGPPIVANEKVHRASDQELFQVIRNGIPGTDMPAFTLEDVEIWQLVAFVRSSSLPAIESATLGNSRAGRDLFFSEKGGCASCHMTHGKGGFPGPDLSDVGATRTITQLRESLLRPTADIRPGYQVVTAITQDGRKIEGVAKSYTNYSLAILDANGGLHLLSAGKVKKVTFRDKPLMPDDYARRLTPEEIEDLLAFLSRQSIRGSGP